MPTIDIIRTHPAPGRGPVGLAYDGRSLWNADYATGSLYQLDPDTLEPISTQLCPGNLSGLAWNGHHLWQSLYDAGWIRAINPATHDFDHTLPLQAYGWISGVAWDGRYLWAVAQQQGQLLAIDLDTEQLIRTLPIPIAGGGLTYHANSLWLGVPYTMRFDTTYQSFEWDTPQPQFAILQLHPQNGQELARYPLSFLPMGIAWVGDTLWLSHTGGRQLVQARFIP